MENAEDNFKKGIAAYKEEDYQGAFKFFRQCLSENPFHSQAIYYLPQAKNAVEKIKEIDSMTRQAQDLVSQNKLQASLLRWYSILELDPSNNLARTYLEQTKEAISQAIQQNMLSEGNSESEFFKNGLQAFRAKDYSQAAVFWEATLAINPHNDQARQGLNKTRSSIISMKDEEEKSKSVTINSLLQEGLDLYGAGNVSQAFQKWKEILELDMDNREALEYLDVAKADINEDEISQISEQPVLEEEKPFQETDAIKLDSMLDQDIPSDIELEEEDEAMFLDEPEPDPETTGKDEQITDKTKVAGAYDTEAQSDEMIGSSDMALDEPDNSARAQDDFGSMELEEDSDLNLDDEFTDSVPEEPPPPEEDYDSYGTLDLAMEEEPAAPASSEEEPIDELADYDLDDELIDESPQPMDFDEPEPAAPETADDAFDMPLEEPDDFLDGDDLELEDLDGDEEDEESYELDEEFVEEEEEEEELAAAHDFLRSSDTDTSQAHDLIDKYFDRGLALYKKRKYEESIIEWKKILDIDKNDENAKNYIEKAITLYEASPFIEEHLGLGKEYFENDQCEDAIKEFEKILEIDPEMEEALTYMDKAKIKLAEVVIPARKSAAGAGGVEAAGDDLPYELEKKGFDISTLLTPKILAPVGGGLLLIILLMVYMFVLSPGKTETQINDNQAQNSQAEIRKKAHIEAAIADADLNMKLEEFEKAIPDWEKVLSLDPENETAKNGLAKAQQRVQIKKHVADGDGLIKQKKFDEAIAEYQKALDLNPDNQTSQTKLTEAKSTKTYYLDQKDKVDKLIAQGDEYFNQADYRRAVGFYRNAMKIIPDDPEAKTAIRKCDFEMRRGKMIKANYDLGMIRYEARKYEDAETFFKKVLELDPENKNAKYYLDKISKAKAIYD